VQEASGRLGGLAYVWLVVVEADVLVGIQPEDLLLAGFPLSFQGIGTPRPPAWRLASYAMEVQMTEDRRNRATTTCTRLGLSGARAITSKLLWPLGGMSIRLAKR
jgi:hypothetical protein